MAYGTILIDFNVRKIDSMITSDWLNSVFTSKGIKRSSKLRRFQGRQASNLFFNLRSFPYLGIWYFLNVHKRLIFTWKFCNLLLYCFLHKNMSFINAGSLLPCTILNMNRWFITNASHSHCHCSRVFPQCTVCINRRKSVQL